MARDFVSEGLGKVVFGGAVGFGLYMLITGLGFGGARSEGRGEGRGEEPAPVSTRLRDEKRLNFLLSSKGFEARDVDWKSPAPAKVYSLEEVISRVKDGGRSDVALKVSGGVIQGSVDAALVGLRHAGIEVFEMGMAAPPARVSGYAGVSVAAARRAKDRLHDAVRDQAWFRGVGIAACNGTLRLRLNVAPEVDASELPREVDGVPVDVVRIAAYERRGNVRGEYGQCGGEARR